jgi:hypothetical protein
MFGCLFGDGHVDGVVREQGFADVAHQDVDSLFAVGYSLGRSETLKKFHSHVLPLSGEKA